VVEAGEGGTTVARQRAVQLGTMVGNDYIVVGGLKEGEHLVVSGVQKIGDGMPVQAKPPGSSDAQPPSPTGSR
jgi:membrane fusion protein (multidrug efflux system)